MGGWAEKDSRISLRFGEVCPFERSVQRNAFSTERLTTHLLQKVPGICWYNLQELLMEISIS